MDVYVEKTTFIFMCCVRHCLLWSIQEPIFMPFWMLIYVKVLVKNRTYVFEIFFLYWILFKDTGCLTRSYHLLYVYYNSTCREYYLLIYSWWTRMYWICMLKSPHLKNTTFDFMCLCVLHCLLLCLREPTDTILDMLLCRNFCIGQNLWFWILNIVYR